MSGDVAAAVRRVLDAAVIDTPDGWVLACPYSRGENGIDQLTIAIVEVVREAI